MARRRRSLARGALTIVTLVSSLLVSATAVAQTAAADTPPPLPAEGGTTSPPSLPAAAGPSSPESPVVAAPAAEETPVDDRSLQPRHFDIRATMNADVLLAYVGLGMSADLGLVPAGPGTIAIGAGFEYDFCGSVCWLFSSLTPIDFSHRQIWPQARASYHLGLKNAKKLDLYPFVGVGPIFARSQISVDNGAARYVGTDTSIGVNFGAGVSLFVGGPVFVGAEARIRWAAGEYSYKLESGDGSRTYDKGSVDTWSLNGLDVVFAIGVRIP